MNYRMNRLCRAMGVAALAVMTTLAIAQVPTQPSRMGSDLTRPPMVKGEYAPDHVVVTFRPNTSLATKQDVLKRYGLTNNPLITSKYFSVLNITPRSKAMGVTVHNLTRALANHPAVLYAELDPVLKPEFLPDDPRFDEQWGLNNTGQGGGVNDADVDAVEAWDNVLDADTTIVAVCDDGVEYTHEDLAANMWTNPGENPTNGIDDDGNGFIDDKHGWDFVDNDNDPMPDSPFDSHGTHVAGSVAATFNNGLGVAGAGPNVQIMALKMYPTQAFMSALTNAIDYAWENGADVISVSYNLDGFTQALSDAIGRAGAADVVYCGSAGNNGQNEPPRSALRDAHDNLIFVAASNRNDDLAGFSNYGSRVEIAAPGEDILSTYTENSYEYSSGTSMSTPMVAGVVATLRGLNPDETAREVLDRLIDNADAVANLNGLIPGQKRMNFANATSVTVSPPLLSITPIMGTVLGGGLSEVMSSDDTHMQMRASSLARRGNYVTFEVEVQSPVPAANVSRIKLDTELKVNRRQLTQYIYLYNNVTGNWDVLGSTRSSTEDLMFGRTVGRQDAPKYVGANGKIRARVMVLGAERRGVSTTFDVLTDHIQLSVTY